MDLLWEGPRSFSELVRLTGHSRQAVAKTLNKLIAEELVVKEPGKRGRYMLTPKGMAEYSDRRADKLLYNFIILPKLYLPFPCYELEDVILGITSINPWNLPAPISYMARMYVSEDIEEEFKYWRSFTSHEYLREVKPEDTLRDLTSEFVNSLVWDTLIERLIYCIESGEPIDKLPNFHIKLTLDISFTPNKNVLKRTAALLALYAIQHYYSRGGVGLYDIIRYLEGVDEDLRGLADLVEKAGIVKVEKKRREEDGFVIIEDTISHKDDDNEKIEAIKILIPRILRILKDEGQIDRRTYKEIMKAIKRSSRKGVEHKK